MFGKWLRNTKSTRNLENKDNKCFKFLVKIGLNYEEIHNHHKRINNIGKYTKT